MKAYLYYCEESSLNDATNYYIGIISKGLFTQGITLNFTNDLALLSDADFIVTITVKAFFKAKCKNMRARTIFWSQGVAAEEAIMNKKNIQNIFKFLCRYFLSFIALHFADIIFLVSDEMHRHYRSMYFCKLDNVIIMPCYNLPQSGCFNLEQYKNPTFVYAGNAASWQGVDLMLDVYKQVEGKLPEAQIMLLSKNENEFKDKIAIRGIKNYKIKYVRMDELQNELHKYKYGFILRDNHIVNRVATPTKMNSYLSNYVIPIFSDTVDDFNRNILLGEFTIKAHYPLKASIIADKIIEFEKSQHDFSNFKLYVDKIFDQHYNDQLYITQISRVVESFL